MTPPDEAALLAFIAAQFRALELHGEVIEDAIAPLIASDAFPQDARRAMQAVDLARQIAEDMARFCDALSGTAKGDIEVAARGLKLGGLREALRSGAGQASAHDAEAEVELF